MKNINQLNGLTLAYLGDAVIEEKVRYRLVNTECCSVNELYLRAKSYVSAKAQAAFFDLMKEENILSDDEMTAFKLGRNAKSHTHAKNTNIIIYRISTGFEALFGYLKVKDESERIDELIDFCFKNIDRVKTIK